MTAPVRIEACAWGDLRFATLARLCGFADAEHALIKCSKIWSWQTEHYTPESPTYVVDAEIIESALGELGAERMVRARLAEATPDGFRIKGSEDRIEWLWKSRQASAKGGEATRRKHANKERPGGYPLGQPEATPEARPQTQLTPGPLSPDLPPDHRSQNSHAPRAIDTSAYQVAKDVWVQVSEARMLIAAEFKIPNIIPLPDRFGMPSEPRGCRDLRDRVREEGANAAATSAHVVKNLIDQAREEKSVEWLSEKAFTAGGWQTARNWTPGQQQKKRANPRAAGAMIGAANPRTDHPEGERLLDFKDL